MHRAATSSHLGVLVLEAQGSDGCAVHVDMGVAEQFLVHERRQRGVADAAFLLFTYTPHTV